MNKKIKLVVRYFDDQTVKTVVPDSLPFAPISAMMGVNTYWWDTMQDPNNPSDPTKIYPPKFNRFADIGITRARFYIDRKQCEPLQDRWAFNPVFDGWQTDDYMKAFGKAGIVSQPCLQNNAKYIIDSWVAAGYNQWDAANFPPYLYQDRDAGENPATWRFSARSAFVAAARWGRNTSVDLTKILMWLNKGNADPALNKPWQTQDVPKCGLNLTDRIELENEVDGTWRQKPYGFLDGRKLAALCSANYDGHKGTMAGGYGAKAADPTMQVVLCGLATADPKLLKDFYDWCVQYRGFKKDGSLDVPIDRINYHKYSTDGDLNQWGNSTTGMPPELSGVLDTASAFIDASNIYLNGIPVSITEWGNDLSSGSPFRAPAIGANSADLVQAAWYVRTIIGYQARKVQELYVFQLFPNKMGSTQQFDTMYLLNNDDPTYTRTVGADYLKQVNALMGSYSEVVQLSQGGPTSPVVYRYSKQGSPDVYCLWMLESASKDGSGNTILTEQKLTYSLPVAGKTSAQLVTLVPKADAVNRQNLSVVNGSVSVSLGLTPIFVVA